MFDAGRDVLVRGIAAAQAKSKAEARFFLEKYLRMEPPIEDRVEAWRYLAEISDDPAEQRDFVGRILAFDPTDGLARRTLAVLDGRLNPSDIVNPDRVSTPVSGSPTPADVERLQCPRCGSGRLVTSADGRSLICEHCHYEEPISRGGADTPVGEHDFAPTMWTAKGHQRAEQTLAFVCGGCGASFLLAPGVQSLICPFCGSVHVASETIPREFIRPDAVVPFVATAAEAVETFRASTGMEPATGPSPVYLPVWMFIFAGEVRWTGWEQRQEGLNSRRIQRSGDHTVLEQPALVCASPRLPDRLQHLVDGFDLAGVVPYDPRQLAGHPAAAYQITLDEASIAARRKAIEAVRVEVTEYHDDLFDLEMAFSRVGIDTFKLLLLPFWVAQVGGSDARRTIFINGQTGLVGENVRPPGLLSRIARLAGF